MKKHVFEAFFKFTKWRNTFLKRFSSLRNEETSFSSVFKFTKWRSTFLKHFSSLQNEEIRFWSAFSSLQNEETRFWSVFQVHKMKKYVFQVSKTTPLPSLSLVLLPKSGKKSPLMGTKNSLNQDIFTKEKGVVFLRARFLCWRPSALI